MRLLFVRHGETDWNVQGKIQGSADIKLNDAGIGQSTALGASLRQAYPEIKKIYTSPQKRARQTAAILGQHIGLAPIAHQGLEEIRFGRWEGLSWTEVQAGYPTEYQEWFAHRRHTRPPAGESYQDVLDRVLASLRPLMQENCQDMVIVTHGGVILALQCLLHDTPFEEMSQYKAGNATITIIDSDSLWPAGPSSRG